MYFIYHAIQKPSVDNLGEFYEGFYGAVVTEAVKWQVMTLTKYLINIVAINKYFMIEIQFDAIITWPIFSQILTNNTP